MEDDEPAAESVNLTYIEEEGETDDEFERLSLGALSDLWDNDEDAIYDNWTELYGALER